MSGSSRLQNNGVRNIRQESGHEHPSPFSSPVACDRAFAQCRHCAVAWPDRSRGEEARGRHHAHTALRHAQRRWAMERAQHRFVEADRRRSENPVRVSRVRLRHRGTISTPSSGGRSMRRWRRSRSRRKARRASTSRIPTYAAGLGIAVRAESQGGVLATLASFLQLPDACGDRGPAGLLLCIGTAHLGSGAASEDAFRSAPVARHRRRRLVGGGDDDHHGLRRQGSAELVGALFRPCCGCSPAFS